MAPVRGFSAIFSSNKRLVFAHRGGAKLAPENTLEAFENGLACGADGLECDVHISADGIPIVIHDSTLDRTTNANGPVSARTAQELAGVDAGYRFSRDGTFPFRGRGIGVSPLEVLLRRHVVPIIIELKQGDPQLARAVADVVRRTNAVERVCVGSFHRRAVQTIRAEAPEIATSACEPEARWTLYKSWLWLPSIAHKPYVAFQVPEVSGSLRVVSRPFVRRVHAERATVQVWVVDLPEDIKRLFDWGVDGVISDRPDVAVATRNEWIKT